MKSAVPAVLILMLWAPGLRAQSVPAGSGIDLTVPHPESGSNFDTYSLFAVGTEPKFEIPESVIANPAFNNALGTGIPGGMQTKRIAGVVPNFQAVSADEYLPPLSFGQKFWLSTQSTFDYSSFAYVGMQAGVEEAMNTFPEFREGMKGYARYYWRTFADQSIGNYMTGAIFPAITHEDPRYYTLYHGSFLRRSYYAFTRVLITRNDAGREVLNWSEILGTGAATAISGFYYPEQERANVGEACLKLIAQVATDGIGNIFEEFWPDINRKFFHERQ